MSPGDVISFVIIQPAIHAKMLVEMVLSFHSIAIRFPFCMIKPQPSISESDRFYSLWHLFPTSTYSAKTGNPITTRVFKQSWNRKKNFYHSICLPDFVLLEHPFCSPTPPPPPQRICRYKSELHANSHLAPCCTIIPNFAGFAGNTTWT